MATFHSYSEGDEFTFADQVIAERKDDEDERRRARPRMPAAVQAELEHHREIGILRSQAEKDVLGDG